MHIRGKAEELKKHLAGDETSEMSLICTNFMFLFQYNVTIKTFNLCAEHSHRTLMIWTMLSTSVSVPLILFNHKV
jgi:hypothetical protein